MPDADVLPRATASSVTGTSLTARAAELADLVAVVVERLGSADPAAASTVGFLREWSERSRSDPFAGLEPRTTEPLDALTTGLRLSGAEVRLLLLAGLPEEHEGLAATFRSLHPLAEPHPTVGLAALVLAECGVDRADVRRVLGEGALTGLGAVRLAGAGHGPERSIVPAEGLWDALHGVAGAPTGLRVRALGPVPVGLGRWCRAALVRRASELVRDRRAVTVVVAGDEEAVTVSRCAALLGAVGATGFAVRLGRADDAATVRRAVVHAAARDAVPVLVLAPADHDGESGASSATGDPGALVDVLEDVPLPVLVCAPARARPAVDRRPVLVLRADAVDPESLRAAWRATPPGTDDQTAAALADRLPLDPVWVTTVCADLAAAGLTRVPEAAADALRRRIGAALPPGAALSTPRVGWERLVLAPEAEELLRDAAARLDHQGQVLDGWGMATAARALRGVRVLLTGMPGTGKTLAAEVLASAARTDLLRVDLSQVVSKWLGETEKNLGAVFDAAERTRAVLLLDEADALFGTRTEISDAHDRYANLETAYLLQRLEAFDGLIVLTTNLRHNIDAAFLRRMDVVVDVTLPGEDARVRLWRLHLPTEHLAEDVDAPVLARMYSVPGGWIRNAALGASFAAAAGGTRIHQHHLIAAVRREYAKAALPFPGEPPRRRDEN